jgi:hypothetical protein
MKKIKLLPLLAVIPMLASCGGKPAKPKFAKFGDVITAEEFDTKCEAARKKTVLVLDLLPAGISKKSSVEYTETVHNRNKKALSSDVHVKESNDELKHDVKNAVVEGKATSKDTRNIKTKATSSSTNENKSSAYTIQETKIDDNKFVVTAYKKSKQFEKISKITDGLNTAKTILDDLVRDFLDDGETEVYGLRSAYAIASEEGKKNYKFYQNDKIFTIEFKKDIDEEYKPADKVLYVDKGTEEKVIQIELDKDKLSYKFWHLKEYEREYKSDYSSDQAKGDVSKYVTREVKEGTWQRKDVTLKALDLANFTKVGASW